MLNYFYMHFGDEVPEDIEKEYNRLLLQEQYQDKKEQKFRVQAVSFEDVLELYPDPSSVPVSDIEVEKKWIHDARIEYLPIAIGLLKVEYPELYSLIIDYFYADKKVSMAVIGKKYGLTVDMVRYRIKLAKEKLKHYIILHETQE